ncbi:hypothetical protein SRHO_G00202910 [Serrasalmus rhombeus]
MRVSVFRKTSNRTKTRPLAIQLALTGTGQGGQVILRLHMDAEYNVFNRVFLPVTAAARAQLAQKKFALSPEPRGVAERVTQTSGRGVLEPFAFDAAPPCVIKPAELKR